MVQDVYSKADVLNTTGSYGAPNFRQVKGSYPLYGMGQPSLNGFKQVLQRLQAQGHEVTVFFLVQYFIMLADFQTHKLIRMIHSVTSEFSTPYLSVLVSALQPLFSSVVCKYLRSQVLSLGCG